ncbi:unnamed protein product [Nyctereutes procyonoides]|uniref:(raccoon dog) hypothetical protein n=1 Tax=Nyctereutes procyonoides TaxID=34880 RepID=A0A811Z0J8_NYCPR|nr:unnamed protein product [Nyctereutes procyonoides]
MTVIFYFPLKRLTPDLKCDTVRLASTLPGGLSPPYTSRYPHPSLRMSRGMSQRLDARLSGGPLVVTWDRGKCGEGG